MRWIATPLMLAALVACESVESDEVLTGGMYADLAVTADGTGASRASAVLRVGGQFSNTFVNLEGDDQLLATESASGEVLTLEEHSLGDLYEYWADFDIDAEDSEFVIAFERTVDEGAPESTMSLPGPFDIVSPEADAPVSRAEELSITWEPSGSGENMAWEVIGDCFLSTSGTIEGDPGTVVVPAGSMEATDEADPTACEATITVSRVRTGTLDAGFEEGGEAVGRQVRQLKFRSDP